MPKQTHQEIIDEWRLEPLTPKDLKRLADLEARHNEWRVWPQVVRAAAMEMFGAKVDSPKDGMHSHLNNRIQHALRLWTARHGYFNEAQFKYAAELLAWAIRAGNGDRTKTFNILERVVHSDEVHERFKSRSSLVAVNLTELDAELDEALT